MLHWFYYHPMCNIILDTFFYYFIVTNIILVEVFHDVTKNKKAKQLCYKNYIVWNMCFKRLVLNLVETTWLRLSSGNNNSFWSHLGKHHNLQKVLIYIAKTNDYAPCIHTDQWNIGSEKNRAFTSTVLWKSFWRNSCNADYGKRHGGESSADIYKWIVLGLGFVN